MDLPRYQSKIKPWLLYSAVGFIAMLVVHYVVGLAWGLSAFACFVGWPVVGTLTTFDDDLPGGWSNPDGTVPPAWRTTVWWGQLATGLAISAFITALDTGLSEKTGMGFLVVGLAAGFAAFQLLRRNLA